MPTTTRIRSDDLVRRLDVKKTELGIDTRTNLIDTILLKGLDFIDHFGYEKLLKIPSGNKIERGKI